MNKNSVLRRLAPFVALGIVLVIVIEIYNHFANPRLVVALILLAVFLVYLLVRWLSGIGKHR